MNLCSDSFDQLCVYNTGVFCGIQLRLDKFQLIHRSLPNFGGGSSLSHLH